MTNKEIVKELNYLVELCKDGITHTVLHSNFYKDSDINYFHGYSEAMRTHIENLNTLIQKIETE
jgi:hypothetical protein